MEKEIKKQVYPQGTEEEKIDNKIATNLPLPSPEYPERQFSKEQALSILNEASILEELDSRRARQSRIESILSEIPVKEDSVSLSSLYRIAKKREFVDKIIALRYPSEEQKLEDIQRYDVSPSFEVVRDAYLNALKNSLMRKFPLDKFVVKSNWEYDRFVRIEEKEKKFLFLKWKKKVTKKIAEYFPYRNRFYLYDSTFINACGETLDKLDRIFGRKTERVHEYIVDYLNSNK